MAVPTALRGREGVYFALKNGASALVAFDDIKSWNIDFEDKDSGDVTFSEATAGIGQNVVLTGTAVTSFEAGSLYKFLWDSAGSSTILVTLAPKGNVTTSAGKPIYTFTATNPGKPPVSNEANAEANGARAEFEFTLNGTTDIVWG